MKGIVTLKFLDANTLEEKNSKTINNTVTYSGQSILTSNDTNPYGYYSGGVNLSERIKISQDKMVAGCEVLGRVRSMIISSTVESNWAYYNGTPPYIETRQRFQPPTIGTTRTIGTICIGDNFPNSYIIAYVGLDNFCYQTDSEVLDIYYRIELDDSYFASTTSTTTISKEVPIAIGKSFIVNDTTSSFNPSAASYTYADTNKHDLSEHYKYLFNSNLSSLYTTYSIDNARSLPVVKYFSRSIQDQNLEVGNIFKSTLFTGGNSTNLKSMIWSKTIDTNYPYKPVQIIHNHSATASLPFIDVDNLASGQGSINVQQGTWSEDTQTSGLVDFNRVDMVGAGAVGVSRYFYRRWLRTAFNGNQYNAVKHNTSVPGIPYTITDLYSKSFHYGTYFLNCIAMHDGINHIFYDLTGITVFNAVTQKYDTFDSSSTHSLPVTSINQVTLATNGNDVYVACSVTGLYKIENILTSPTIIKLTCAGVNDNKCHAVCNGYNGSIWAIFDGGLANSVNGGATWSVYNTASAIKFNHFKQKNALDITSNWELVRYLVCDIQRPSGEIGILIKNTTVATDMVDIVWWKIGIETAYTVGSDSAVMTLEYTLISDKVPSNLFRCSITGGRWVIKRNNAPPVYGTAGASPHYTLYLTGWGSVTGYFEYVNENQSTVTFPVLFTYDYYETPFVQRLTTSDTWSEQPFADIYLRKHFTFCIDNDRTYRGKIFDIPNTTKWNGMKLTIERDYDTGLTVSYTTATTGFVGIPAGVGNFTTGPLNGYNHASSEITIDDYRWNINTLQWEENYFTGLNDISGNTNHAIRHNFPIESNTFNTRAAIDCSETINNCTTEASMITTANYTSMPANSGNAHYGVLSTELFSIVNQGDSAKLHIRVGNKKTQITRTITSSNNRYIATCKFTPSDSIDWENCVKTDMMDYYNANSVLAGNDYLQFFMVGGVSASAGGRGTAIWSKPFAQISNNNYSIKFKINQSLDFSTTISIAHNNIDHSMLTHTAMLPHGLGTFGITFNRGAIPFYKIASAYSTNYTGTNFVVNSAFVANDYNGTNIIELKIINTGATSTIQVYSGATLKYTATNVPLTATHSGNARIVVTSRPNVAVASTANDYTYDVSSHTLLSEMQFIDNTTTLQFGKTGTACEISLYENNLQRYSGKICSSLFGITSCANLSAWYGSEMFIVRDNKIDKYRTHGMCGTLANPQIWNVALSTADVSNDYTNINGVLSTKPISNMIARYDMLQNMVGTETKPTHLGFESLPNGTNIKFNNGASGTSFIGTDYYTWSVFDGIVKDNALKFDLGQRIYYCKRTKDFIEIENTGISAGVTTGVTVPNTASIISEYVNFRSDGFNSYQNCAISTNGQISGKTVDDGYTFAAQKIGARSMQQIPQGTDFEYTFKPVAHMYSVNGVSSLLTTVYSHANAALTNGMYVNLSHTGTMSVVYNGTSIATGTYNVGDSFKIQRIGNMYTVFKNLTSIATATEAVSPTPSYSVMVNLDGAGGDNYGGGGYIDCKITYTKPANRLELGNSITETGRYSPNYIRFDNFGYDISIKINGVEATKTYDTYSSFAYTFRENNIPALTTGQVLFIFDAGVIYFSPADVGKTVDVKVALLEKK